MNEIVGRIVKEIEKKGVKAIDVCRAAGLASSTISMWKRTERVPDTQSAMKIAEYLGVSPEYLLTGFDGENYYFSDEVAEIAQELYDQPHLKTLFDASRKLSVEDIKAIQNMVDLLYQKEHPED